MSTEQILDTIQAENAPMEPLEAQDATTDDNGEENAPQEPENGDPEAEEQKTKQEAPRYDKRAAAAIRKKERQLGRYEAMLEQTQKELQEARAAASKGPVAGGMRPPPRIDRYDNFGDYQRDMAIWEHQHAQYFAQREMPTEAGQPGPQSLEAIQRQAYAAAQQQVLVQQYEQRADIAHESLLKEAPEYGQLFEDNEDILRDASNETKLAFLQLENPALAVYTLMKEGKAEAVIRMNPYQAAMEAARAEIRGKELLQAVRRARVSNAPTPVSGVQGAGARSQLSPLEMPEGDFRKKFM